jgi:hypothetical protein
MTGGRVDLLKRLIELCTVANYRGQLSSVLTPYFNPNAKFDPGKKAFKIVCTGEAPLDVLLMANSTWNSTTPKNRKTAHAEQPMHESE